MRTIQMKIDPDLLSQIDSDEECKQSGRSVFLQTAVRCYLEQKRLKSIAEKYRSGYSQGLVSHNGLSNWEDEQVWPGN